MKLSLLSLALLTASFLLIGCSPKIVHVPVEVPVKYAEPQPRPDMLEVGPPLHVRIEGQVFTCFDGPQSANLATNIILLDGWGETNFKILEVE